MDHIIIQIIQSSKSEVSPFLDPERQAKGSYTITFLFRVSVCVCMLVTQNLSYFFYIFLVRSITKSQKKRLQLAQYIKSSSISKTSSSCYLDLINCSVGFFFAVSKPIIVFIIMAAQGLSIYLMMCQKFKNPYASSYCSR